VSSSIDESLKKWDHIKDEYDWHGLLIGNGASCNIWDGFRYPSLYQKALEGIKQPLSQAEQDIFTSMGTTDFEKVLEALWTAKIVCQALGQDSQVQTIEKHYQAIQHSLIEAVHSVHIPWLSLSDEVLSGIHSAILPYHSVYSTNYDLLMYWATMYNTSPSHKDYFWSENRAFDITNTQISGGTKRILYMHGALHLVSLPFGGGTRKLIADRRNLLSQFGITLGPGEIPLFVSEGTAEDKLSAIRNSDYLSFAYEQFINHQGNLVIFGHSLRESDAHLIKAIQKWKNCTIAISMRQKRSEPNTIIENKARLKKMLPDANLEFFNARTHPLGKSILRIRQNGDSNT